MGTSRGPASSAHIQGQELFWFHQQSELIWESGKIIQATNPDGKVTGILWVPKWSPLVPYCIHWIPLALGCTWHGAGVMQRSCKNDQRVGTPTGGSFTNDAWFLMIYKQIMGILWEYVLWCHIWLGRRLCGLASCLHSVSRRFPFGPSD